MGLRMEPIDATLKEGLRELKTGALLYAMTIVLQFMASLFGAIIVLASLEGVTTYGHAIEVQPGGVPHPSETFHAQEVTSPPSPSPVGLLLIMGPPAAVALIYLTSLYKLFRAADRLWRLDPDRLRIGRIGAVTSIAGVVLAVITMIVTVLGAWILSPGPPSTSGVGPLLPMALGLSAALLMLIIGNILFGMMLTRLPEVEPLESRFRLGGWMLIVGGRGRDPHDPDAGLAGDGPRPHLDDLGPQRGRR